MLQTRHLALSLAHIWASLGGSMVKNPPANSGDVGLIPGSGQSPGERNGYTFQCSCLGNSMDRGDWWATVSKDSDTT